MVFGTIKHMRFTQVRRISEFQKLKCKKKYIKSKHILLSSDVSSSAAGKINVKVSTRHPVCMITGHSAENHQKITLEMEQLLTP